MSNDAKAAASVRDVLAVASAAPSSSSSSVKQVVMGTSAAAQQPPAPLSPTMTRARTKRRDLDVSWAAYTVHPLVSSSSALKIEDPLGSIAAATTSHGATEKGDASKKHKESNSSTTGNNNPSTPGKPLRVDTAEAMTKMTSTTSIAATVTTPKATTTPNSQSSSCRRRSSLLMGDALASPLRETSILQQQHQPPPAPNLNATATSTTTGAATNSGTAAAATETFSAHDEVHERDSPISRRLRSSGGLLDDEHEAIPMTYLEDDDSDLFRPLDDVFRTKVVRVDDLARMLVNIKDTIMATTVASATSSTRSHRKGKDATSESNSSKTKASTRKQPPSTTAAVRPKTRLEVVKEICFRAARLVSDTLQSGMWPSPYQVYKNGTRNDNADAVVEVAVGTAVAASSAGDARASNDESADIHGQGDNTNDEYAQHLLHMETVGNSIEMFARDVILPDLLRELKSAAAAVGNGDSNGDAYLSQVVVTAAPNDRVGGKDKEQQHRKQSGAGGGVCSGQLRLRVFMGTMVLLRELLVQNKVEIFGPDFVNVENGTSEEEEILTNDWAQAQVAVTRQILATTIILSAMGGMRGDVDGLSGGDLCESFLELTELYDGGDEEFTDCLMELEETAEAVFGGGKRMREDEFEAWRNTTNLNVERHPFYRVQDERRRRTDGLPKPMSSLTMTTNANSTSILDTTSTASIWYSPVPAPTAVHLAASKGLGRVRGQYSLPSE